jgi:hypothetical protein
VHYKSPSSKSDFNKVSALVDGLIFGFNIPPLAASSLSQSETYIYSHLWQKAFTSTKGALIHYLSPETEHSSAIQYPLKIALDGNQYPLAKD